MTIRHEAFPTFPQSSQEFHHRPGHSGIQLHVCSINTAHVRPEKNVSLICPPRGRASDIRNTSDIKARPRSFSSSVYGSYRRGQDCAHLEGIHQPGTQPDALTSSCVTYILRGGHTTFTSFQTSSHTTARRPTWPFQFIRPPGHHKDHGILRQTTARLVSPQPPVHGFRTQPLTIHRPRQKDLLVIHILFTLPPINTAHLTRPVPQSATDPLRPHRELRCVLLRRRARTAQQGQL